MHPRDRYFKTVLPVLKQGIKDLEHGVKIFYPPWLSIIFAIPSYVTQVSIQETISGSKLSVAVNFHGEIAIADTENSKINSYQPTDTAEDGMFRSVVAAGESPTHKLPCDQSVRLGAADQSTQNSPHMQEYAPDVRKNYLSDSQGHDNEVGHGSTISLMHTAQPVGETVQESHLFLLSKAEILCMKWLELVKSAQAKPEMTADLVAVLADLKPVLIDYTVMIDQILMGCAQLANGKNIFPEQGNFKATNKRLKAILSKLNPRDIKQIIPETIDVKQEDFLCALLGLNSEVANHLKSIPEEFRQHEPDDYYIKSYIEEKMDFKGNGSEEDDKKCFEECGFTSARAETLAKKHKKSALKNHQSLSLWLERYVDDMFRYVVSVGGDSPRYPLKKKVTDKWVDVELTRYAEDDDGCPQPSNFKVHAVNNPTTKSELKYLDFKTGQRYWYHGTDHASVISILEEGIQTRRGRAMQDFSDDDGFYLSSNFKEAKKWAFSRSRPAVIIFKKSPPSAKFIEMNLSNNNETQWAQIVKYNRCGRSRKCLPEQNIRTAFHESDFVLGPRSDNGRNGTPENDSYLAWQPSRSQDGCQQLCIRSEKMAEAFGEIDNIEGVIFY